MHILVTGGAGFIGSNIVEHHLNKGDKVLAVDNLSTGSLKNIAAFKNNPLFQFSEADLLTWSHLNESVLWADRIYHCAAVVGKFRVLAKPIDVLAVNIAAYERLLRAVASSKWRPPVLIASSSSVYGDNQSQPHHESDALILKSVAHSHWSYAISKLVDETYSQAYAKEKGLSIVIARLFNHIGPRQTGYYGMVVPRFIEQALKGEPITVYGDGNQTRSFCDVRDAVVMLDLLLSQQHAFGEIINVGSNHEISINELALIIKTLAKSESAIQHVSYQEAYGEDIDETLRRQPCLNKIQSLISYQNKWTLNQTLIDLIKRQRQEQDE